MEPIEKATAAANQMIGSMTSHIKFLEEQGHSNIRIDQVYTTANQLDKELTLSLTVKLLSDGVKNTNPIGFTTVKEDKDGENVQNTGNQ